VLKWKYSNSLLCIRLASLWCAGHEFNGGYIFMVNNLQGGPAKVKYTFLLVTFGT